VDVAAAADLLAAHRLGRRVFDGFPGDLRPADEDQGYEIQYALHERLTAAGRGALAGYKIGCTTPVMQAYLGIHNPCSGGVFAPTVQAHDAAVPLAGDLRTGVECELAVRLGRDLPTASAPFSMDDIRTAVAGVMAAIEIVEDRYRDYEALAAPTLVADDFFGAGCVLGEEQSFGPIDLSHVSARMLIDDREVGRGHGSDILGDPLSALLWLANDGARRGRALAAGQIVLLGSLVQTNWIEAGQVVTVENDAFGAVRASFSGS
jgi:2-keto-4-pentenoate hydratase